jgi:predicted component of type VI protein secretion system
MRQQLEPPKLRDTGSNPAAMKRLLLTHNGRQVEVDKDRFLLGRSKTQADLRLEDPNVSRQHAAIERVGSAWFIVDLGSTNGIFVNGQRVARRALADGDVIVITSQEIRCSVR